MRSKSDRNIQTGHDRKAREQDNKHHRLLTLPAEIRNRIYDIYQSSISASEYILDHDIWSFTARDDQSGHLFYRRDFPALLHLCRQTRMEFQPIFFSKVTGVLSLKALLQRSSKEDGRRSFLDVLDNRSITFIGKFGIHSTSKCIGRHVQQTGPGRAPFSMKINGAYIVIERLAQNVRLGILNAHDPRQGQGCTCETCCYDSSKETAERVMARIRSLDLHDIDHQLCKNDFRKLARSLYWSEYRKLVWKCIRSDSV